MADPIVPNFNPTARARLVTDRFDFQKHIVGEDFNHDAGTIVLDPAISVNGGPTSSDLQEVITQINALVPQVIPDATGSVKGLIKLSGDLAGSGTSAATPRVSGLQGFPITTSTPSDGDVLTYDAGIPAWKPSALSSNFSSLTVSGLTTLNGSLTANAGYNLSGTTGSISATGAVTVSGDVATLTSVFGSVNVTSTGFADINVKCLGGGGNIAVLTNNGNISVDAGSIVSIGAGYAISINSGSGGTAINSGDFSVTNNVILGSNSGNSLTVPATATFQNGVTLGSSSSDSILIKGTIGSSSVDTVVQGMLRFTNSNGRLGIPGIILNDANQTVSVINNKFLKVPGTVTNSRTYTLTATNAQNGDWFRMYNEGSFIHLINGIISDFLGAGGERLYVRIGGVWHLMAVPT